MTRIVKLLLLIVLASVTACNDSEYRGPSSALYTSMVTYDGERTEGGIHFSYTFQEQGGNHEVSLWSSATFKDEIEPGTRLVLNYRYSQGYTYPDDGLIEIISAQRALTAELTVAPNTPVALAPIGVTVLVLSGNYIDLWCRLAKVDDRKFSIELDAATENTANPTLYISTSVPDDKPQGYDTNYAASFDISRVWENPATQTLTVKINNTTNPRYSTFSFNKQ